MSQPLRRSTSSRAAARQVKLAIVPPVTKPTALPGGSPSRSSSQVSVSSSTAEWAGVRTRRPEFWSQALTSQSTARAAGWVPPMTKPKNRPPGIAVSPGSHAAASSSTTCGGVRRAVAEHRVEAPGHLLGRQSRRHRPVREGVEPLEGQGVGTVEAGAAVAVHLVSVCLPGAAVEGAGTSLGH